MADAPDDLVEVYRAQGLAEAHAIRILLDAEGIPARIDNEHLHGAVGELPAGWATAPRVLVPRTAEPAARAVLARAKQESSRAGGDEGPDFRCLACRAVMGEADACPACGWSYRSGEPGEPTSVTEKSSGPEAEVARTEPDPTRAASSGGPAIGSLWWEVAAVLAVGVVPNMAGAVVALCRPAPPLPYWLDGFYLGVLSGCTIFVTLYLIGRSGEPWERFGITRPRLWDVPLGLLLVVAAVGLWQLIPSFLWPDGSAARGPFSRPEGHADHAVMAVKYGLSAFAEEVVARAIAVRLCLV